MPAGRKEFHMKDDEDDYIDDIIDYHIIMDSNKNGDGVSRIGIMESYVYPVCIKDMPASVIQCATMLQSFNM